MARLTGSTRRCRISRRHLTDVLLDGKESMATTPPADQFLRTTPKKFRPYFCAMIEMGAAQIEDDPNGDGEVLAINRDDGGTTKWKWIPDGMQCVGR